jgi:aspartokinase/homoserine dehydrogenase 1
VEQDDVRKNLFIPEKFFKGSLEQFWEQIPELDESFELRRQELEKQGKRLRFVASMDKGVCQVGLQEIDSTHPFMTYREATTLFC